MIAWRSRKVDLAIVVVFVAAIVLASRILGGCAEPAPARPVAAEAAYTGEHMACVEQHDTRAAIDACREAVRVRWGRYRDGGVR